MDVSQALIDIIDKRVDAYLKSSKVICRYTAKVLGKSGPNKYKVILLGYDTVFTFPARSYISAEVGDYVMVESKFSNLSNGIIVDVIKKEGK